MMQINKTRLRQVMAGLLAMPLFAWAADPQIAAFTDDGSDPAVAGGLYTYQIRVDNNALDAAINTRLRVTVPAGASFVSAAPASQNCAPISATVVECALGTLGASGADARTVSMTWRAIFPGLTSIASSAEVLADNDDNPNNNRETEDTTVNPGGNLSLGMTGAPGSASTGSTVTYTLTAANAGPNAVTTMVVTNNLPPTSTYVGFSGAGWSCVAAGSVVTCSRTGPYAAGTQAPPLIITSTLGALAGSVTNSATVSSGPGGIADPDTSNNTATVSTAILTTGADLRMVSKTLLSGSPVATGATATFRLSPRNFGPVVAETVELTDTLPAGWTVLGASGTGWTCSTAGQTVTCTRASLAVGVAADVDITVRAPAAVPAGGASYTNTARVTASTSDPVTTNNSASVSVTVLASGADLSLSKDKTPYSAVVFGGPLTSIIRVTNGGPLTATGPLRVIEVLSNETYVGFSGTGWSCSLAGGAVVCDHANAGGLPVGSSLPALTINTAGGFSPGRATNTACTGGSTPSGVAGVAARPPAQGDPDPANDCATAVTGVEATGGSADLAVLSVVASTPLGGDKRLSSLESAVTLTTQVANRGPSVATAARVEFYHTNHIVGQTGVSAPTLVVGDISGASNGSSATFSCSRIDHFTQCLQTGGELRPGDVISITSTLSRPMLFAGGSAMFIVNVSNSSESDPVPANNSGSDTFTIDPQIDVEVTGKTSTPSSVQAGDSSTYVISFRNRGSEEARDVAITDSFSFLLPDATTANPTDPGLVLLSAVSARPGASCRLLLAGGASTAAEGSTITPANNRVRCDIGTMAPGEELSLTLTVRPLAQSSNPTRLARNTAVISTSSVEGDLTNNSRANTLTIVSNGIDLLVNKTDLVDPVPFVSINDLHPTFIDYRVRVRSNGPSFGTNVRISESMTPPAGKRIRFVCDTTGFGAATCNAVSLCSATNLISGVGTAIPTFTCAVPAGTAATGLNVGELAVGQTKDIFLRYQVLDHPSASGDVFTTSTSVASSETETLSSNNSQTELTTTRNIIDIRVAKSTSQPTVNLNQPFNWRVTVANNGPGDSLQTDLTDTLPPGTTVTGPATWTRTLPAGSGTCTLSGLSLSCPLGVLSATGVATVTIPVSMATAPANGIATNRAVVDTDPAKTGGLDFPGNNNVATATVTVVSDPAAASISGRVWLDGNNNGLIDGSELGIAGAVIELTGTDSLGAPVNLSITTASDGSWSFANLRPGTYTVRQPTQPAGTLNGATVAGTGGGAATTPLTPVSSISAITLVAGQQSLDNLFGEVPAARLSGRVWLDSNDNGLIDGIENGIDGVVINLSGTTDLGQPVSISTTTGFDGSYSFLNLRPGSYTVTEPTQPPNTGNGRTVPGTTGGTATGVGTLPSAIGAITLPAGQHSQSNNFGETSGAQIAGRVFLDANNNGAVDGGEAGIAGVTLTLTGVNELGATISRITVSGPDGTWAFADLLPGTYSVVQAAQPPNTLSGRTVAGSAGGTATTPAVAASTISAITLSRSQQSVNNLFGEIPVARLSGRVWSDPNNDGLIGSIEVGLPGVTVVLTGTDDQGTAISRTTITGADGSYEFGNLRPGTYAVTEPTQPPETTNGLTVPGSLGGSATPVTAVPSAITGITLPVGGLASAYNFGEIPDSADMVVTKTHTKPVFTVGLTGGYEITVRNAGTKPTAGAYVVQDRLPAGMSLNATPSGSGWQCTGAAGATSFSCESSAVLAPGAANPSAITAVVNVVSASAGGTANNVVLVEGGGEAAARGPTAAQRDLFTSNPAGLPVCTTPASQNLCRDPVVVQLAAAVSGTVWTDTGTALRVLDPADRRMTGWLVEVLDPASGTVLGRGTTDGTGAYRVGNLEPGVELAIRFREPTSGVVFGYPVNGETSPGSSGASCLASGARPPGAASSCPQTGAVPELRVVLSPGAELPQQSLPIDPSGVVYDSVARTPVPGSVVTLSPAGTCAGWSPATSVVAATLGGYTVNGSAISMTVGADGFYQFMLAPAAPARCNLALTVLPPTGYTFVSELITPTAGPLTPAGAAGTRFAVQPQIEAPQADVGPATTYYLLVSAGSATPTIVHNHIPLDPPPARALALTKTGDRAVAEIGDSVRYTLTVRLGAGGNPAQTSLVDQLPAGFTYIPGTAMVNNVPIADPAGGVGPTLVFRLGPMRANRQLVLQYRVRVGVGAMQGDGINRAQAQACSVPAGCVDAQRNPIAGAVATNKAEFQVRVVGGAFTADACVLGKVFVDCNNNHIQDPEEVGIPGVRLILSDGTALISDVEGKYSMCGLPPRSHVLRADPTTLPRGSRLTTSSNRNLGDAGSLWLDLKNGELHRADFIEGSCSNTVLEQTKARRAQGEVRSVETEKKGGPALRFDSKAHQLDTLRSPPQGTDGANQLAPKPRATSPAAPSPSKDETNVPTLNLPMNQPPPTGRTSGERPDQPAAGTSAQGGSNGTR